MFKNLITKAELARRADVSPAAVTKACSTLLKAAVVGKRIDADHIATQNYIARIDPATLDAPARGVDKLYESAISICNETGRFTVSNIARKLKIGFARANRIFAMMQAAGLDKPTNVPPPPPPITKSEAATPVVKGQTKKNHTKKSASLENLNDDMYTARMIHDIPDDIKNFVHMTLGEIIQRYGTDIAFLDWLKATKEIENINEKRLKNAQTRGELVNRDLIKTGVIEPFDTAFNKLLTDGAKTLAVRICAMNGAGRSVEDCQEFAASQISSFIKPAKAKIARTLKNA